MDIINKKQYEIINFLNNIKSVNDINSIYSNFQKDILYEDFQSVDRYSIEYYYSHPDKNTQTISNLFNNQYFFLSFYNRTFTVKIYTYIDKMSLKYSFTTLENFYKSKKLLKSILVIYNHLHSIKTTKSIKTFITSLEYIFQFYEDRKINNPTQVMFDFHNKTTISLSIIKSNIVKIKNPIQFLCKISCEFIHERKLYRKFKTIIIEDYRITCKTIRDLYNRTVINNTDTTIMDSISKIDVNGPYKLSEEFIKIICEDEYLSINKRVKGLLYSNVIH